MSSKTKKSAPKVAEDDEDQMAFLMAAVNAKKSNAESKIEVEDEKKDNGIPLPDLPPRPIDVVPDRKFAPNELCEYNEHNGYRSTSKECIETERIQYSQTVLPDLREAAEVHRKVRQWAMANIVRPGVVLYDMCSQIEEAVRVLTGYEPIVRGLAFPCGCSLNNCAAHYTPLAHDKRVLQPNDVMKIDFGVNINGSIIDSAFTVCFDPKFDKLIEASREATNTGVKMSGIDARLDEIGNAIHEVFDSYSVDIDGKHYDIKPISNLSGHLMKPYTIHAGKSIPICRGGSKERMEEGELYALETFGSTGRGRVNNDGDNISHFMVTPDPPTPRTPGQRKLLKTLQENFSTLAFTQRFLDRIGEKKYQISLRQLCEIHAVRDYPALSDIKSSWVAQTEHTFLLLPTHKEVLSRGDDY